MDPSVVTSQAQEPILVSSRSFAEYIAFFDLGVHDLHSRILDCCAGASSFVAEAHAEGFDAIAADPVYGLASEALAERTNSGLPSGNAMIDANSDRFTFYWYGTPERRAEMRRAAAITFTEHHRTHPGRYIAAALPELPFASKSFDLALCSHLLFTWATHLDEAWHFTALVELCRVAEEVRVFPLVLQGTGESVEFLPSLQARLQSQCGINSEIVSVPYEFQVGAHHMLRLRRPWKT
ncbi:MAG: hypothetical protein Q7K25_02915 [Actinomycetota bacterium]|nr:hypothetical protein [Actinomycetota bacterium]